MKLKINLLIVLLSLYISGCCPCNFGSNPMNSKSDDENKSKSKFSVIDQVAKMKEMQKLQQKLMEAQQDPDISPEEIAEIVEEFEQMQEEMIDSMKDFQDSDFFKEMEKSNDPRVKHAFEQIKKGQEMREMMEQQKNEAIQQAQQEDIGVSSNSEFDVEFDSNFDEEVDSSDYDSDFE